MEKWRVRFKTFRDEDAVVSVYVDGYDGVVKELEAAPEAMSTEELTDKDFLCPVRGQSGYLRVVDNGDLSGLMPSNNKSHRVELTVDGVVKWCGWMAAEEYTSEWDVEPIVVEYPLLSGLSVLDGERLNAERRYNVVPLASLVYECLQATGVAWEYIWIPVEIAASATDNDILAPLLPKVSLFNFMDEERDADDEVSYEGELCSEVLAEFCKLWGWTAQERGRDVWFTSSDVQKCVRVTMDELRRMGEGEEISYVVSEREDAGEIVNISDLDLAGDGHTKSVVQGKSKVSVTAELNVIGDVVPDVNVNDGRLLDKGRKEYRRVDVDDKTWYEQYRHHAPKNDLLRVFRWNVSWTQEVEDDNPFTGYGATLYEYDRFNGDDLQKKKNYSYVSSVRIDIKIDNNIGQQPTAEESFRLPVLRVRSGRGVWYGSGAFVISARTTGIEKAWFELNEDHPTKITSGKCVLPVKFRVGKWYWSGSGWTTQEVMFPVTVGEEDGQGKIVSTKTLSMPYNGADGYVMAIDRELVGEVELSIHMPYEKTTTDVVYLDGLAVDYYKDDSVVKDDRESRVYSEKMNEVFSHDRAITLKMASDNNCPASYGVLSHEKVDCSRLYLVESGETLRMEVALLEKMKRIYGENSERLTLQVENDGAVKVNSWLRRDGKTYRVLSEKVDWCDGVKEIVLGCRKD